MGNNNALMTLAMAVKKLNQICTGLGDAVMINAKRNRNYEKRITAKMTLHGWMIGSFDWSLVEEKSHEWSTIYNVIQEMME